MKKKTRQMLLLLGLLVAAIAALLIVKLVNHLSDQRSQAETEANTSYVTFPSDPDAISWQTDDATLTLTKDENGSWTWSEDTAFPLDTSLVESLTGALNDLSTQTAFSPEDALSAYGLDTPSYSITVSGGSESKTLLFGGSFLDDGDSYYYAKLADDDTIYVLDSTVPTALVSSIYDLADCAPIASITETDITSVTIQGAEMITLRQQATEDENGNATADWTLDDTNVTEETLTTSLVSELLHPTFTSMAAWKPDADALSDYGLASPAAQVTVTCSDSNHYTLAIGTETSDGNSYYATTDGGNSVYLISASKINDLLDVAANGFTLDTEE